ncbi:MAG: GHKL domain-containing protein [Oscillospiraceae bacterium]|nr:GHKL domain-containing protein [Oscillospiraceae bacterium]
MKKNIFVCIFLCSFMSMIICFIFLLYSGYRYIYNNKIDQYYSFTEKFFMVSKEISGEEFSYYISDLFDIDEVDIIDIKGNYLYSLNNNYDRAILNSSDFISSIKYGKGIKKYSYNQCYLSYKYNDNIYRVKFNYGFSIYFLVFIFCFCMVFCIGFSYLIYRVSIYFIRKKMDKDLSVLKSFIPDNDKRISDFLFNDKDLMYFIYIVRKIKSKFMRINQRYKKYQYILDNTPGGFLQINKNKRVVYINLSGKNLLDIKQNLINKNIIYFVQEKEFILILENCIKNQNSNKYDLDLTSVNGKILSIYIHPYFKDRYSEKTYEGVFVFIEDVTQSKKALAFKNEFIANASHELKTPITSILGFSELLLTGMVYNKETIFDYLNRIKKESERMSIIINDILSLTKIENIDKILKNTDIDVKDICDNILNSMYPQILEKNINVEIKGEGHIIAIYEDIFILIKNLIENSIRYNRNNGLISIIISDENCGIRFMIADTGIGIAKEHHKRIFERFYTVDKSRSRISGGTGLGLSIVKRIVNKYDGDITIKSNEKTGITIEIFLSTKNIS